MQVNKMGLGGEEKTGWGSFKDVGAKCPHKS